MRAVGAEETIDRLGLELPPAPRPLASYVPVRVHEDLAYVSGQIANVEGQVLYPGTVGADVTVEQAREAARRCALQILSALRGELGSLDRVAGIVQVSVFVASDAAFGEQPSVANAASDVFVEIFGDAGAHARAAVGVASLPLGASVEVAAIAALA